MRWSLGRLSRAAPEPVQDGTGEQGTGLVGGAGGRQILQQARASGERVRDVVLAVEVCRGVEVQQRPPPLELQLHGGDLVAGVKPEEEGPGLGADDHQPRLHRLPVGRPPAAERQVDRRIGEHAVQASLGRCRFGRRLVRPHRFGKPSQGGARPVLAVPAELVSQPLGEWCDGHRSPYARARWWASAWRLAPVSGEKEGEVPASHGQTGTSPLQESTP